MAKAVGQYEYRVVDEGSEKQFAKKVAEAEGEGYEVSEFRTGSTWWTYHYVALLRRPRNGTSAQ